MKIAPTLFNLDKSICYTTNSVAGWYILEEAILCLSLEAIGVRVHDGAEMSYFRSLVRVARAVHNSRRCALNYIFVCAHTRIVLTHMLREQVHIYIDNY